MIIAALQLMTLPKRKCEEAFSLLFNQARAEGVISHHVGTSPFLSTHRPRRFLCHSMFLNGKLFTFLTKEKQKNFFLYNFLHVVK
jgi:hypothetical protein